MGISRFIDSHAHLNDDAFANDLEQTIERARAAGVFKIIVPGDRLESSVEAFIIAATHDDIYAAAGFHPHEAKDCTEEALSQITRMAAEPKTVAIGEIGLDYHYNHSPAEIQKASFRRHLEIAKQLSKPVIIHCREAYSDLISILREEKYQGLRGVCHCFSGTREDAKCITDLGFYISFAGPITFPKAHILRDVVSAVSIKSMLLETDSPYLAPQQVRGKRNEPAFVAYNAEKISEIHGVNIEEITDATNANCENLFSLSQKRDYRILTYQIAGNLYINITSNCTNDCIFCPRKGKPSLNGSNLYLSNDASADEIINDIGDPSKYDEVVFCGFGEPLLRLDVVKKVAEWLRKNNARRIRINTNGHANTIYKRNVLPELEGLVDEFSVSLNACNADQYQRICRSYFGAGTYDAVNDFIHECKKRFKDVTVSMVGIETVSIEDMKSIVEKELGCRFRARQHRQNL